MLLDVLDLAFGVAEGQGYSDFSLLFALYLSEKLIYSIMIKQ